MNERTTSSMGNAIHNLFDLSSAQAINQHQQINDLTTMNTTAHNQSLPEQLARIMDAETIEDVRQRLNIHTRP